MAYGLTTDGFVQKTLADLKAELESALQSAFGESIDLSPQSVFGQIVGVYADRLADLWALGGQIEAAFTPDGASGVALDELCAITGTVRLAATHSKVNLILVGTTATVIPADSAVTVDVTATRFVTSAAATLVAATAWASGTAYAYGDVRKNGSNVYVCTVAGTSAGSGGPTGTGLVIVDNTCTWRFIAAGTGYAIAAAIGEATGPKVAAAYSLNTIASPLSGWTGVTNTLDATLGSDLESDAALRTRREDEIRAAGKASVDSIRAALLAVSDVSSANVFENPSDTTDGTGLPPHAIECLVRGGLDAAVAASIFDEKAAGIATYGTTTVSVTDSQGFTHSVKFTRPTEIPIYVIYNLTVDLLTFPADGAAQVKAALVAFGNAQKVGKDAVDASILAQAFKVTGVLDGEALIGTAPAPTLTANIPVSTREIATFDTSRITVNISGGTP